MNPRLRRFLFALCLVVGFMIASFSVRAQTPAPAATPAAPVAATPVKALVAGDAGGTTTGTMNDIATASGALTDKDKEAIKSSGPGLQLVAEGVGQNRIAINTVWLLICGFLVMFMQAGFALVETGFTRAKSACHTMMMNFCIYFLAMLGFWAVGFALMYGAVGPIANLGGLAPIADTTAKVSIPGLGSLFATQGFFLSGNMYDVGVCAMFLFQMVFMDTTATIPTGAMAERWKFTAFIWYALFVSMILYPIFGHWAWGGGWLSQLGNTFGLGVGYVDFAGCGVVHMVGAFCGLAGAIILGPRIGKYNRDGTANAIPGHNIPLALLGCMILALGWFGFNAGSTFGASGIGNLRIGIVATTTMLASAGGAVAAMIYMYYKSRTPDPTMVANGFLGGLVAITAAAGFVSPSIGVLIGFVGGLIVCWAIAFLDVIHVDDPIGAVAVHGGAGLWGVLAVGIFADGTYGAGWNGTLDKTGQGVPLIGLLYGGTGQFWAQCIGAVAAAAWGFGASWVFFKVQGLVMGGIRSSAEDEIDGLDIPEIGIVAYPPDYSADYIEEPLAPEPATPQTPPNVVPQPA
ncbi:MAG TPA: ammonium transporter [Abditibacteriaceae bacterium]|jgi:Amt family ammonium transporter